MRKVIGFITLTVVAVFTFSACTDGTEPSGQKAEDKNRQSNYERLVRNQPAHSMDYSPTRETKNFWVDTWNKPGKLAYVYMRAADSHVFGYYVFVGLPVSYCTSLVVPYQFADAAPGDGDSTRITVPGPSIDGTFSSSSNCNEFYGKDAVSGSYVEYSIGMGINQQLSDQPLPQYGDADPLASATVQAVKKQ